MLSNIREFTPRLLHLEGDFQLFASTFIIKVICYYMQGHLNGLQPGSKVHPCTVRFTEALRFLDL